MCGITTSALLPSRAIYIESGSGEGRALVMARAQRGPARQVAGAREGAPVRSDLGDHDLGHASAKSPGACPAAPSGSSACCLGDPVADFRSTGPQACTIRQRVGTSARGELAARCAGKRIFSTSWERIELDAYRLAWRARLRVERGAALVDLQGHPLCRGALWSRAREPRAVRARGRRTDFDPPAAYA